VLIRIEPATDINIIRELFTEYGRSLGLDLEFQGFSKELETLPAGYDPILLAHWNDAVAACVALRDIEPYRFNPIEGTRFMELRLE
jgi:putative acetyltransferase